MTANPTIVQAGQQVSFTSAATDADGDDLTYSWDFQNDGTADSSQQNPTFTYATPGTKTAKVTVSDGEDTASKTVTVQVLAADDPEAEFRVLVFSETTGFRHDSIDEGIAAIQALGLGERLPGRRHRGLVRVPRGSPGPLRHGRVPVDHG